MANQSGASDGGIVEITSVDASVDITDPTGPVTDLSVTAAAAAIAYTGIAPSTATTVEEELDHRANHVGTKVIITSFVDLEALFPAAGGLHTINTGAEFTAFDGLPAGNHINIVFPGSITSGHSLGVLMSGDYAGPIVSGEVAANGIAFLNVNAGGSDMELLSPVGRFMSVADCTFLGQGGVEVKAAGTVVFDNCVFEPSASGAAGISITSTLGDMLMTCLFNAPGGSAYTALTIAASATIVGEFTANLNAINSATVDDVLFFISPFATLPGGGVRPATVSGVRTISGNVRGPGGLFAAGSLTEDDIEIVASGGQGTAPNTRLLGDAFVNVFGGTLIPMSFAAVTPGDAVPVPASNGVGGVLALQGLSSHFTMDVSDPLLPFLRFDGPDGNKGGAVHWSFDFIKNGAANSITGLAAIEPAAGGGYVPITGSESTPKLAPTTTPNRVDGDGPVLMSSGDKLRILAKSDGTSAIDISQIVLTGSLL